MLITEKKKLRTLFKSIRNGIEFELKKEFNNSIFTRLINSEFYKNSSLILTYVSLGSEADTTELIKYSLSVGKRVAVPHCIGNQMNFYEISDIKELINGRFGIPTVNPGNNQVITEFQNAICIVPGLSFDLSGGRLGYGGGFYDRFLSDKSIRAVALSYERCLCEAVPTEESDISVSDLITENTHYKL
ncbi:MAG: 5-formyltetrahydrofolate cyclo-ligase [Ruminococcaceae bacterium]|nr:5-formyltetrahydrofolate cyclo-ligase [Oscillospiraceae bacterium]